MKKEQEFSVAIDSGARTASYIKAAQKLGIRYKTVNCYDTDIIEQLQDCDALCWHFSQSSYRDKRIARSILYSAETMGLAVYPNRNTCFTFDDKAAQKYLLEALNAPMVKSWLFWEKQEAEKFLSETQYPLVYKKAGGAGSKNVSLLENEKQARRVLKQRFAAHVSPKEAFGGKKGLKQKLWYFLKDNNSRLMERDKGYFYVQEFLPDNGYDIRVTVLGKKAVIFKRFVRDNDFRASGSGKISYQVSEEDLKAVPAAFRISEKLKLQTCAYDFIYNQKKELNLVEMSYGFVSAAVEEAPGWYDSDMKFYPEKTVAEEEVLMLLQKNRQMPDGHLQYGEQNETDTGV